MKAKIETITPEIARELLANNPKNRNVRQRNVNLIAQDILAGNWELNGETIIVAEDGSLSDGQHRLYGVVQADTAIQSWVIRGAPAATRPTIDSGAIKTLSDVLTMEGGQNTKLTAAAARSAYGYIGGVSVNYKTTKATLHKFTKMHPHVAEVAHLIAGAGFRVPTGPLAAVMFLGTDGGQHADTMGRFLDGLKHGAGLFKGDPRLTLREWISAQRQRGRGLISTEAMFAATARAWNAYAANRELTVLKSLDVPTQNKLPIIGFDRIRYPDVPDLVANRLETATRNLGKGRVEPEPTPRAENIVLIEGRRGRRKAA